MKRFLAAIVRHQAKLWAAAALTLGVLFVNLAASPRVAPGQWEYRVLTFIVRPNDAPERMQTLFADTLNRESADGWEFVGPCARASDNQRNADYLVLRRRRQ